MPEIPVVNLKRQYRPIQRHGENDEVIAPAHIAEATISTIEAGGVHPVLNFFSRGVISAADPELTEGGRGRFVRM